MGRPAVYGNYQKSTGNWCWGEPVGLEETRDGTDKDNVTR
jgi:hypothetical protein